MENYIHISTLNDFVFCPYSIYLQGVYMETDEGQYKAAPQARGKVAHQTTDNKTASNRADDILSLPVYSEEYGLMGKIDVYKRKEKQLIERKYEVNNTDRVLNNLRIMIEDLFAKKFDGGDSVMIFDVNGVKLKKYGNAIHRDQDIVYF